MSLFSRSFVPRSVLHTGTFVALLLIAATAARAQFSGNVGLGVNSSSNAAGTDTTAPDRPILPSVDLQYKLALSRMNSLTFEAAANPYYSSVSSNNSYFKYDLGITAAFYLDEDSPKPLPVPPRTTAPPVVDTPPAGKGLAPPAPESAKDSIEGLATAFEKLSARLDSLDIDATGMSDDSSDAAYSLKDSLSESVAAVAEVLRSGEFTSSVQQVLDEEIGMELGLLAKLSFGQMVNDSIRRVLVASRGLMERATAANDLTPLASAPIDTLQKALPAPIVAKLRPSEAVATENAPVITLVDAITDLSESSSQDLTIREDAPTKTSTTLATLLSIPAEYEQQTNSTKYKAFSYTQFTFEPRISYYASEHFGVGATYGFGSHQYPNDTLYTYNENKFRLDGRLSVGSVVVISAQFGMSVAKYLHPFDSVRIGPRGKIISEYTEPSNFSMTAIGLGAAFFLGDRVSLGAAGALTRSSQLHPYLFNAILGRSQIGGQASDDPYSYELTRFSAFASTRIFWDISPTFDLAFERREYGKGLVRTNVKANIQARTDDGTIATLDLTRLFVFDDRLLGAFDSFTPELTVQYSKYKSTIKQYNYKDTSITLSVAFGF